MIIIDSNIWIFAENDNAAEHDIALRKISEALEKDDFGLNVIVASEVYHILSKLLGIDEASRRAGNLIANNHSRWLEFDGEIVNKAVKLSHANRIRINDALIAQQALNENAAILTDNIKDFKKVSGLKIIPMR